MRHTSLTATQHGFTFIELVVAIVILLVLTAVAAPRLATAASDMRLRASAATVASLVNSARQASVLDKKHCSIECSSTENKCDLSCLEPDKTSVMKNRKVIIRSRSWKFGSPARAKNGSDSVVINFHPDGTARGPALELSADGGRKITVEVFGATALPYVYEAWKK